MRRRLDVELVEPCARRGRVWTGVGVVGVGVGARTGAGYNVTNSGRLAETCMWEGGGGGWGGRG